MAHPQDHSLDDPPRPSRPAYRVPIGMPLRDEGRRASALVSVAVHVLVIGLLVAPFFLPDTVIARIEQGAGGAGPAGGGGGGRRGSGGTVETLRYVRIAPDPAPTAAKPAAVTPPVPKVVPPKPVPVPPPEKAPEPKVEQQSAARAPQQAVASATPGSAGGSGTDGTNGAGPGTGGGVGSGVGTGRGSGDGPGTGGGKQENYSPKVLSLNLPPMPPPRSVRGWTMIANFDVDSTGQVLDFKVNTSPDRSFDRQLAAVLKTYRFRPGTRPDGSPLRMIAQLSIDF
jgi:periplasmic protein TonB